MSFTIFKRNELTGILKNGKVVIPPIPISIEETPNGFLFNHVFEIPLHLIDMVNEDVIFFERFEHLTLFQIKKVVPKFQLAVPFLFYTKDLRKCCLIDDNNVYRLVDLETLQIIPSLQTHEFFEIGEYIYNSELTYSFKDLETITFLQSKIGYFIKRKIVGEIDKYKIIEINGEFGIVTDTEIYVPCVAQKIEFSENMFSIELAPMTYIIDLEDLPKILNNNIQFKTIEDYGLQIKRIESKMVLVNGEKESEEVDFVYENVFFNSDGILCVVIFNGIGCYLINIKTFEIIEQCIIPNAKELLENLTTEDDISFILLTNLKALRDVRKNYIEIVEPF